MNQLLDEDGNLLLSLLKVADTPWARAKGLLFSPSPETDEGLLITPCNSVHMFFMSYPLDIIFINKNEQILKIYHNLKPWRVTSIVRHADMVLEIAAGVASSLNLQVGQHLVIR